MCASCGHPRCKERGLWHARSRDGRRSKREDAPPYNRGMDSLLALGLFVGIPVALAAVIAVLVVSPRGSYSQQGEQGEEELSLGAVLITSAPATPNPAALPWSRTDHGATAGGARGNW